MPLCEAILHSGLAADFSCTKISFHMKLVLQGYNFPSWPHFSFINTGKTLFLNKALFWRSKGLIPQCTVQVGEGKAQFSQQPPFAPCPCQVQLMVTIVAWLLSSKFIRCTFLFQFVSDESFSKSLTFVQCELIAAKFLIIVSFLFLDWPQKPKLYVLSFIYVVVTPYFLYQFL